MRGRKVKNKSEDVVEGYRMRALCGVCRFVYCIEKWDRADFKTQRLTEWVR